MNPTRQQPSCIEWLARSMLPRLLLVVMLPAGATAQEPIVPLQFSFSDPGARSMGFGGAFVALADDATAAYANPSGLTQLVQPEVSIEGLYRRRSTPFTRSGRAEGLPSGYGIDTMAGLANGTSETTAAGLSFLSLTYPMGNWSFALFRHELSNFEFFSETQGLFGGGTDCCQTRYYDQRATTDLAFSSYGISGAYRVNEHLSLGIGVVYHRASLFSDATLFLTDDDSLPSRFAPNSYHPDRSLISHVVVSDDTDVALVGGFLWTPSERWRIGGVFRQGPELEVASEFRAGEAVDLGVPPGGVLFRSTGPVEMPWVLGLGFAYRAPNEGLTVSFQWDHVEYSKIVETVGVANQTVDDVRELHLGIEYAFLRTKPVVALRIGVWMEPDHQIRAKEDVHPFTQALLPRGRDQMHYAAGLGLALRRFQIDVGVDFADQVDSVSLSMIYTFR